MVKLVVPSTSWETLYVDLTKFNLTDLVAYPPAVSAAQTSAAYDFIFASATFSGTGIHYDPLSYSYTSGSFSKLTIKKFTVFTPLEFTDLGFTTQRMNELLHTFDPEQQRNIFFRDDDILTGNSLNDVLAGYGGNDVLSGEGGDDTLLGGIGNDILSGGAGNDKLDGGAGVDSMRGGQGNDSYYIDSTTDSIVELTGEGTDTVYSSVAALDLSSAGLANIENAVLTGSLNANLNGSTGSNALYGNTGGNIIRAAGGNDIVVGYGGNDSLWGGDGNDVLVGGAGRDGLVGGAGADRFVFTLISDSGPVLASRDLILDFKHGTDKIDVSMIDANGALGGNTAFVFLSPEAAAFTGVAGQLRWDYQGPITIVQGDVNGDRIADFWIDLSNAGTLSASDFVL